MIVFEPNVASCRQQPAKGEEPEVQNPVLVQYGPVIFT